MALLVAFGVLSSIVLLVADAVQSFEREDVRMFQASAIHMTVRARSPPPTPPRGLTCTRV